MSDKTEIQAFPRAGFSGEGGFGRPCEGMTLRDYFAAKAMSVYMQNKNSAIYDDAKHAYAMADEMLKARKA